MKTFAFIFFLFVSLLVNGQSERTFRWISKHSIKSISLHNDYWGKISYTFNSSGQISKFRAVDTVYENVTCELIFVNGKVTKGHRKGYYDGVVSDSLSTSYRYDNKTQQCTYSSKELYWGKGYNSDSILRLEEREIFEGTYTDTTIHFAFSSTVRSHLKESILTKRNIDADTIMFVNNIINDTSFIQYSPNPPSNPRSILHSYHYLERASKGYEYDEFYKLSELKKIIRKDKSIRIEYY